MLPRHDQLKYVVGNPGRFSSAPIRIFAPEVQELLASLSVRLMADDEARKWADVVSFAWWCRKANIERLRAAYDDGSMRVGRGIAFHITPNNIPVNFAFSWAFSLLSGNANLIRLPDHAFPQLAIILRHIQDIFEERGYDSLADANIFLSYEREEQITSELSSIADIRIIWGGDQTIQTIRKSPLPPRGIDVGFADRYSFSVIGTEPLLELDQPSLIRLITAFFNDTYLMDQNACSSPRLVVWYDKQGKASAAQDRFWNALQKEVAARYELSAVSAIDKFTQVCRDAIQLDCWDKYRSDDNRVVRLELKTVPLGIENRRGNCGYFYEFITDNLENLAPIINSKFQTLTYYGIPKELLASFVSRNRITGIDRIVPVGSAMDIGIIWDGYDLVRTFSRICHVC